MWHGWHEWRKHVTTAALLLAGLGMFAVVFVVVAVLGLLVQMGLYTVSLALWLLLLAGVLALLGRWLWRRWRRRQTWRRND